MNMILLLHHTYDAKALVARHPLKYSNPRKQAILQKCVGEAQGVVHALRYTEGAPKADVPLSGTMGLDYSDGFFDYAASTPSTKHWYPNFADPDLFGYWDSDLLAQDEIQTLEMPVLTSLRRQLVDEAIHTGTTHFDKSTPWLVEGVQRFVDLDVTDLYGNAFDRAPLEQCVAAATKLDPPVVCNLYAIAAPACGTGHYTHEQIKSIFRAAYTAFCAAKQRTLSSKVCHLHIGYWGCGAFGGNRVLMVAVQLIAARFAGVDKVTFHSGGDRTNYEQGVGLYHTITDLSELYYDDALWELLGMDFEWGVSDGN